MQVLYLCKSITDDAKQILISADIRDKQTKKKKHLIKSQMAATSVVVLDRGNNTTCTINLYGKYLQEIS